MGDIFQLNALFLGILCNFLAGVGNENHFNLAVN